MNSGSEKQDAVPDVMDVEANIIAPATPETEGKVICIAYSEEARDFVLAGGKKAGEFITSAIKLMGEFVKAGCEKALKFAKLVKEKAGTVFVFDGGSTSTKDWDVGLAQTNMVVSSTGITAFAALKLQDIEDKIKLPLTPLIVGFGISFVAAFLTVLLVESYPRVAKAIGKVGLITTAITFSALVYGLL